MGNVIGGYGYNFPQHFYLGGEVFAGYSGASSDTSLSTFGTMYNGTLKVESPVYHNFSLRLAYKHMDYDSFSSSVSGTKISPSDNQGSLGIIYHIDYKLTH